MCNFFSFRTHGSRKYYFNWEQRQELLKYNPNDLKPDSHSSQANFYKLDDDKGNKYEYNPLTGIFTVDYISGKDDHIAAERWVRKLDFKKIVEPLIIKPIIHPLKLQPPEITDKQIELLKQWASVQASVEASVRASVEASVRASVGASVWASVRASVEASVWASVRASVQASVEASVWASVRASVGAYISSFFNLKEWKYIKHKFGKNPFQHCIDLWEQGLVPSFNGKTWRLHGGEKAEILYEMKP